MVLYNKFGGVTHHTFATKAAADRFAAEYRTGVYSLQDGVIKKIDIQKLGGTAASAKSGGSTGNLVIDENAPKGQTGKQAAQGTGQGAGGPKTGTGYVGGKPRQIELAPIGKGYYLRADAAAAFLKMQAAAKADGVTLNVSEAFRTNERQQALFDLYQAGKGAMAAKPGYSNHQGGVAVDLRVGGSFTSPTYQWLQKNAGKFGFTNTEGKKLKNPEAWHWGFAGTPI